MSDSNSAANDSPSFEAFRFASEVKERGAEGVQKAQQQARDAGVPPVYSINGILHWELPDGSLTTVDPWQGDQVPGDAPKPQA